MANNPAARKLRFPPDDLTECKFPKTRQPLRHWFRVHRSEHPAQYFSLNDIHRFSHPHCPCALLYLGIDTATCLFERFGDEMYDQQRAIAHSLWLAHSVSTIRVPEIHVCDLTNAKTLSALRIDLGALMHHELKAPQAWGLAIQSHPAHLHGIKFKSRFNGKPCLALFQRDGIEKQLRETSMRNLLDDDAALDWLQAHKVSLY